MGKKRRQHDTNVDGSEESTESGEGYNKLECSHFSDSINIIKLRKAIKDKKINNLCIDCQKNENNSSTVEDEFPNDDLPLWICLQCGHIACGREQKGHAKEHFETPRNGSHCVVIDTYNGSVWCYKCDNNVSSPANKKKLKDITDILKKSVKSSMPIQSKSQTLLCQNEINKDNENKKIPNDLPKVGGLLNLGNTCFFNAVLQCLAQTPYLIKVLDDLQVSEQKFILPGGKSKRANDEEIELPPIEGILEKTGNFTPVLRKTLTEMQNSDGQVYRPTELLNSLKKKPMQCTDGGQHDSHELLRQLLELVRNEDVGRYKTVILKEVGLSRKTNPQSVDDNLKSVVKFYGNQANAKFLGPERVFRGELVSTIQCLECNHSSTRNEPFLDLSLPILIDKSLPLIQKKKSNFKNLVDSASNSISNIPSKNELKKLHKANKKKNRTNRLKNRENNYSLALNTNHITEEKKGNVKESEESDADVEDNIENEDTSTAEVSDSIYNSEKIPLVTSPASFTELSTTHNVNDINSAVLTRNNDFTSSSNEHSTDINYSQNQMELTELIESKKNGTSELSLSTSLINHSDFTSPEGPTISPLSSPLTSKESPTSSISSAVDGNELSEKNELSDKDDSLKKSIDIDNDELLKNQENNAMKKMTNGISDMTLNIAKLNLKNPCESPNRYPTKEEECSIQSCLNQFTAREIMNGNNKVGCAACTERENKEKKVEFKMICTDSTKQYLISHVPAVLILHLKRFQVQKFSFRKVGKHVSFPMLLDLAPVCKDYNKPRIYALYGVVEHSGNLHGGHYVAFVKSRAPLKPNDPRWSFLPTKDGFENKDVSGTSTFEVESDEGSSKKNLQIESPPGKWYHVSDSRVHEVDEKTVLDSEAYLLFYERIL